MRCTAFFFLFLPFLSAGCAGYFKDRLKDASEMFETAMGLSIGVEGNIRATKVLQVGLGSYSGDWIGLREGRLAYWKEARVEMGISPFYYQELIRKSETLVDIRYPLFGEPGYENYLNDFHCISDRGFFELGITVNLIVLGVDVALEGAEIFDFLSGWFGLDVMKDDCFSPSLEDLVDQVQSSNPYYRAAAVRGLRWRTGQKFDYLIYTAKNEHPEEQIDAWRRWKGWLATRQESYE